MANFERFSVWLVPFPFADKAASKRRPAVIVSDAASFNLPAGHSVMAMITSSQHQPWPLDVVLSDLKTAGLPAPSRVRMKLFTLDHRLIIRQLGDLGKSDKKALDQSLARLFDIQP